MEFKPEQNKDCSAYEELGVPIEYAYGPANLQAQLSRLDPESPEKVLEQIKRGKPSHLLGKNPQMTKHKSIKTWFTEGGMEGSGNGKAAQMKLSTWGPLGRVERTMRQCSEAFRNGVLILLYSANAQ